MNSAILLTLLCCALSAAETPAATHHAVSVSYYPGSGDGGVIDTRALQYYPGIEAEGVVNPYTGEYLVGDGAGGAIGFTVGNQHPERATLSNTLPGHLPR